VRKIHAKIRNKRQDWSHKESTNLIKSSRLIRVGNVSASRLMKTRMAKSVTDAGWFQFKEMLKYKAITHGVDFEETGEAYSTVTCSQCLERTGPRGVRSLGIRDWTCSNCGSSHDRDVNAAKNILLFGMVGRPETGRLPLSSG
jgi:IS605 OrfB family transposase